jgi:hypothetical protein
MPDLENGTLPPRYVLDEDGKKIYDLTCDPFGKVETPYYRGDVDPEISTGLASPAGSPGFQVARAVTGSTGSGVNPLVGEFGSYTEWSFSVRQDPNAQYLRANAIIRAPGYEDFLLTSDWTKIYSFTELNTPPTTPNDPNSPAYAGCDPLTGLPTNGVAAIGGQCDNDGDGVPNIDDEDDMNYYGPGGHKEKFGDQFLVRAKEGSQDYGYSDKKPRVDQKMLFEVDKNDSETNTVWETAKNATGEKYTCKWLIADRRQNGDEIVEENIADANIEFYKYTPTECQKLANPNGAIQITPQASDVNKVLRLQVTVEAMMYEPKTYNATEWIEILPAQFGVPNMAPAGFILTDVKCNTMPNRGQVGENNNPENLCVPFGSISFADKNPPTYGNLPKPNVDYNNFNVSWFSSDSADVASGSGVPIPANLTDGKWGITLDESYAGKFVQAQITVNKAGYEPTTFITSWMEVYSDSLVNDEKSELCTTPGIGGCLDEDGDGIPNKYDPTKPQSQLPGGDPNGPPVIPCANGLIGNVPDCHEPCPFNGAIAKEDPACFEPCPENGAIGKTDPACGPQPPAAEDVPNAPTSLKITGKVNSPGKLPSKGTDLTITWQPPAVPANPAITAYWIEIKDAFGELTLKPTKMAFSDPNAPTLKYAYKSATTGTYRVYVWAENAKGVGAKVEDYAQVMLAPAKKETPLSDIGALAKNKLLKVRYNDIKWLAKMNITIGSACKKNKKKICYNQADPVNRGSMADFMYRLMGMPDRGNVSKQATWFKKDKDTVALKKLNTTPKSWRYDNIRWLAKAEISKGCAFNLTTGEPNKYCPWNPVSRAAMAEFMFHLAGDPLSLNRKFQDQSKLYSNHQPPKTFTAELKFYNNFKKDKAMQNIYKHKNAEGTLDQRNRYYDVLWLIKNNITTGIIDKNGKSLGRYDPNTTVNRGQMAQFMHKLYYVMLTGRPVPKSNVVPAENAICFDAKLKTCTNKQISK